ncbi:eukaryotic translation initiation factor 3 subunit G [Eurytemora carolleeae]|uniref:eukaryotic translation initiation factor 3 subunit G n=1 Tax=Eurytemora carolleeae TaxID=1294199 RepID=UPI000C776187|nr:eukaryotic translation initiation factor 3 subunit G [Eurytemora carolleeae]|eukprot:XP_023320561.1 eukaryotic translation initiation factor 3 subunit G-like [Eurytemora affinis]
MPEPVSFSWAEEVENSDKTILPQSREEIKGDTKTVTEFAFNEDGKKVKIVRTYKIVKKMVPKVIAARKSWPKFGMSKGDKPGPNPQTTIVAEEIYLSIYQEQSALDKIKASGNKGVVKCRICKEDHWTTQCPYKDTLGPLKESLTTPVDRDGADGAPAAAPAATAGGKYVPPSKRGAEGRIGLGDTMPDRRRDDTAAIRVSNISENAQENDLQELFKNFGHIARIFLAKDKVTGLCKGFAFVNYYKKEEAAKAIATLNGYGYDHLILSVEWAKPSTDR